MFLCPDRISFEDFRLLNEANPGDLAKAVEDKGRAVSVMEMPEAHRFADATERRTPAILGIIPLPFLATTRRVRLYRYVCTPDGWHYIDNGQPTPGLDVERLEASWAARRSALFALGQAGLSEN